MIVIERAILAISVGSVQEHQEDLKNDAFVVVAARQLACEQEDAKTWYTDTYSKKDVAMTMLTKEIEKQTIENAESTKQNDSSLQKLIKELTKKEADLAEAVQLLDGDFTTNPSLKDAETRRQQLREDTENLKV